ncbi:restriction endonuclease subunit S [Flavobacterium sp.]|uniref:restriction endonuclease subunit S n=1 Tax=Flavobacterium sp. TaxID=239 RepID=UPI0035B45F7F
MEVPQGYKQTSIGIIPEDWEVKELKDFLEFKNGINSEKDNYGSGFKFINVMEVIYNNIITDNLIKGSVLISESEKELYKVNIGDLLFNRTSETPSEIGLTSVYAGNDKNVVFGGFVIRGIFKDDSVAFDFKKVGFRSNIVRKQIIKYGQGAVRANIGQKDLEKVKIPVPPLPEQQKIAEILSAWDKAIETCQKTIEELRLRNKGLAQQLLSGKISNKNEEDQLKDYHIIGKYVKEVSKRNTALQEKRILSVTNSRGFINQSEQFGRELASADLSNYKIVKKGQFAYNPSRVNVGSLDMLRTFDAGVLSPMYVVFEVTSKDLIPEFLYYHLKTYWFIGHIPMFVQGSVRDTLSFDGFSGMKFYIPTLEEQKKIVTILDAAASELKHYEEKLNNLKLQKKGLMQQLLTGKVRVKI